MYIYEETEDGRGDFPLFMVLEEANLVMEQAGPSGGWWKLEICMVLRSVR
jgi:hypothetical protein